MLRLRFAALFVLLFFSTMHRVDAQSVTRPVDTPGGVRSDRLIVQLKPSAMERIRAAGGANVATILEDPRGELDDGFKNAVGQWRVSRMRPLHAGAFRDSAAAAALGLDRTYVLDLPERSDSQRAATFFMQASPDLELAFADTIGGIALVPNDPGFSLLYAMDNQGQTAGGTTDADIDAVEAWSIHTGDAGTVTIAILDSGVSPHDDFGARLIAGRNTADPGNPTLTTDACPHGTHVAGTAAATGDNGIGVAGVTWGADIMPVRVLTGCTGGISDLASGIIWAAENGADIINMSLQYYNLSPPEASNLQNAVNYAHGLGAVLVAAAGNNNIGGVGVVAFPARLNNVIGVSATDSSDTFAVFSNFGDQIDVCAPGKDIWSTWTGNNYAFQFGTSMASPLVAGVAALLRSYEPSLTNLQIGEIIRLSTDDRGPAGWDNHYGSGRLNAWSALDSVPCITESAAMEAALAEEVPYPKSRAISFRPGNAGELTAIRVRLLSLHHPSPPYSGGMAADFSSFEGQYRWVGPPMEYVESTSSQVPFTASVLQCTPYYHDWGSIGLLHVLGAEIIPSSNYEVRSIREGCYTQSAYSYAPALEVGTGRWGDVAEPFRPPATTQQPDIADISALVDKFRSLPGAPIKVRSLLSGQIPNLAADLDFGHVSMCVDAFRGLGYPVAGPQNCE